MEINCGKIAENYLLIKNPLYSFSFPISVLVAIIIFGFAKAYKWSSNTYVNQILIPVLGLLLTMVILDIISRLMISKKDKMNVTQMCNKWINSQKGMEKFTSKQQMDNQQMYQQQMPNQQMDNQQMYQQQMDNQQMHNQQMYQQHMDNQPMYQQQMPKQQMYKDTEYKMKNMNSVEPVIDPISEIPNISPSPLPFKPNGQMCIQDSNGCNICSGSGQNPYNLIAPIPGPQWLPESAETVQNRLKNNNYTSSKCPIV